MTVKLAKERDGEHIFKIWRACFTDDKAYIDNYLKLCLPYTKTWLLGLDSGEFVSCLSVIPSFVTIKNKNYRGGYLYAVGTLPEHRGNSYSSLLMDSAIKYCKESGMSYLLVKPASESLFPFYIKSSFNRVISKGILTFQTHSPVKSHERSLTETSDINARELLSMRAASFSDTHFLWSEDILNYAIIEAKSRGGQCKKFRIITDNTDNSIYFVAYPDDFNRKKIKVLETNVKNKVEIDILIALLKPEFPEMEEMVIDSSSNNLDSLISCINPYGFFVEKSALLHSFDSSLSPFLEKLHLSLPME